MSLKRKAAVFTIVQDEPFFLPKWVAHYAAQFPSRDMYILNHGDGPISTTEGIVVPIHRTASFDHNWLRDTVQTFQRFLLQSYECVLFVEVDEFIFSNDGKPVMDFIDIFLSSDCHAVRCHGFQLVHMRDTEPAFKDGVPVLKQRGYWSPSDEYSKILLSKLPLNWICGFHDITADPTFVVLIGANVPLTLLHMHRIDFELCRQRHLRNAQRKWSTMDLEGGFGVQNRLVAEEELTRWFYEPQANGQEALTIVPIPEAIRDMIKV
jgi:hypothetical protein